MTLDKFENVNPQTGEIYPDTTFQVMPTGTVEETLPELYKLVQEGVPLQREIDKLEVRMTAIKARVNELISQGKVVPGKYITMDNYSLNIISSKEYSKPEPSEVLAYMMENNLQQGFNSVFSVGYTKLKDLIGAKAEQFRKLLDTKTTKLSFK